MFVSLRLSAKEVLSASVCLLVCLSVGLIKSYRGIFMKYFERVILWTRDIWLVFGGDSFLDPVIIFHFVKWGITGRLSIMSVDVNCQ